MGSKHILVVDDEAGIRNLLKEILEEEGYSVSVAEDAESARINRQKQRADLTLLDIWLPDIDGLSLLREWTSAKELAGPIIIMTGHGTLETAIEAIRLGAYDFIEKPFSTPKLLISVERALENARLSFENNRLKKLDQGLAAFIVRNPAMEKLRENCIRICGHRANVLIFGECGVGKETTARYIHKKGPNKGENFVRVNLAGLSSDEQEKELFGFESTNKIAYGALELAQKGTAFLKDITNLNYNTQAKLVRAMEDKVFFRCKGQDAIPLTARIMASSKKNLDNLVSKEQFREDLFYQLNVIPLEIPALRERRDEIDNLLDHFVQTLAKEEGLPLRHFSKSARARLKQYDWPGNLRELKNYIQRLLILGSQNIIHKNEVDPILGLKDSKEAEFGDKIFQMPLKLARIEFEKAYLERQLKTFDGNVAQVSQYIEIERTHLYRKLRSLRVDIKDSKKTTTG